MGLCSNVLETKGVLRFLLSISLIDIYYLYIFIIIHGSSGRVNRL